MPMRDAIISFPMLGLTLNPPSYFSIGGFHVYYYGVIIALGLLLAVFYASRVCSRFHMTMDAVYDYLIWAVIAAVICARLYYCVMYTDSDGVHTYLRNPAAFLRIRDGGLAIYGGVIGAAAALLIRARMRKESVWKALDIMAIGLLIGQCIGRWGNFFNREAFGGRTEVFCRMGLTPTTVDAISALHAAGFSDAAIGTPVFVHPTFLYESLWNLIGFLLLHWHSKKHRRYQGQYFLLYLIWYGFGRMLIEGLRTDSLWLIPGSIRVSQLLAALTLVVGAVLYFINRSRLELGMRLIAGRLDADDPVKTEEAESPQTEKSPEDSEPEASAVPEAPEESPEDHADNPTE